VPPVGSKALGVCPGSGGQGMKSAWWRFADATAKFWRL